MKKHIFSFCLYSLNNFITFLLLLVFFSLFSCKQDLDVKTYTIDKRGHDGQLAKSMGNSHVNPFFSWDAPKTWVREKSQMLELGKWEVKDKNNDLASANIIVLTKKASNINDNVNRWREQISLKKISAKDIKKITKSAKGKLGIFSWFRIVNMPKKKAILAAIVPYKDYSIFIKLIGSAQVIVENELAFIKLVKSIKTDAKT